MAIHERSLGDSHPLVRSNPRVGDSTSTFGRRTFAAGLRFENALDVAVPVEAPERSTSGGRAHVAVGFHGAAEDLQVSAPDLQQSQVVVGAPLGQEPKIGGVADERVAGLHAGGCDVVVVSDVVQHARPRVVAG